MRTRPLLRAVLALLALATASSATRAQRTQGPAAPEIATGVTSKTLATAKRHMVAAANPLAVDAGLAILAAGGSAVDAAIATQLVLNIVEPQSSGIGGGAFLLHFNSATAWVQSYDGRETATAAAKPDRFLKPDGMPRAFDEAVFGGESVGVPGVVGMLALAHRHHGKLQWARLFEPAIKLAADGFSVSPRLHALLKDMGAQNFADDARAVYFDEAGRPRDVGYVLRNPALAETLRSIATGGADAFYRGPIADGMVRVVTSAPNHKGDLTLDDLASYQAKERPAVCVPYRAYKICGMGPPSSGGLTVGQVLALLAPHDLGSAPMNAPALHLIAEAEKLAYADRDQYIADPERVAVPGGMLDPAYLVERGRAIDVSKSMAKAQPGLPPGLAKRTGLDATTESNGTSHISIVDASGNAVALTTSIENAFGSRLMAGGFLLNNQLTDFSFRPTDASGVAIANAVGGGKRPRSSMAPTIVLGPDGYVRWVIGSPGGSRIILYVVKAIVALVDWKLDAQAAADLANFGSRNGPFEIERGPLAIAITAAMQPFGHQVQAAEMTSGLHIIARASDGVLTGGADPRREGIAKGE